MSVTEQRTGHEVLPDGNWKIPLPGGHHAEVRPPDDLRRRDIRAILKTADEQGVNLLVRLGFGDMALIQEALVARMVNRWSLLDDEGNELPVTLDTVADLRPAQFAPLRQALAPAFRELMGGDDGSDPKSAPSS